MNTENWEEKFKAIFPDTKITISLIYNDVAEVEIKSEHNDISINLSKLMRVGEIFGTLDFDVKNEHTVEHCGYSEWTQWDEHTYTQTFRVDEKNLNSGLPWEKSV